MSSPYKHILKMNGPRGHTSEAYWSAENSDQLAIDAVRQLAESRSQVLGLNSEVVSASVISYDADFKKQYSLPVQFASQLGNKSWSGDLNLLATSPINAGVISAPGNYTPQDFTSWASDVKSVSALVNITVAPETNKQVQTKKYLGFCPDLIDYTELDPVKVAGTTEKKAFEAWNNICLQPFLSLLQNHPFAMKVRDTTVSKYQIGAVNSGNSLAVPPTFASVVVAGDQTAIFPPGSYCQIRGRNNRRFHGRQKELNGKWQVFSSVNTTTPTSITTISLICTIDLVVDVCKRMGTVEPVKYKLAGITASQLLYATGRRRGRRSA